MIAGAFTLSAQTNDMPADTLSVVRNAHSVVVTRSPGANTITVVGQGDNPDFFYQYKSEVNDTIGANAGAADQEWGLSLPFLREQRRQKSEVSWLAHTYIGICMPVDGPDGLDQSVDVGFGKLVGLNYTPWKKGPTFSFGVGFFLQKFALHRNQMFAMDGKQLIITDAPEGATDKHVRLFNFGFDVPLTVTQEISHGFKFSAGVIGKFNTYTTASNKFTVDGRSYEQSFKGLQQRILTYDIYGAVGWDDFALYFRYAPVSMFKSGNGPQFDVISFGVNLGF